MRDRIFEQRALAGAVAADDADDLARLDLERDVLQRPEVLQRLVAAAELREAAERRQWRGCRRASRNVRRGDAPPCSSR